MKKLIFAGLLIFGSTAVAHAQFSDLINNLKNSPIVAQQGGIQGIIAKAQSIATVFSQMPLNSGKLDFIKAALPILTQASTTSANQLAALQQGKPVDPAQTTQLSGLLDKVKNLMAKKWSNAPLTQPQVSQASVQTQQFGSLISNIISNEGGALKGMLQMPSGK